MTPDQLNEIEAMATSSDRTCSGLCEDVLALVALVRELETAQQLACDNNLEVCELAMDLRARAEKAEARVKELEQFVTATDLGDIRSRCHKAEARVAVLREALRHIALPEFAQAQPRKTFAAEALSTLDPAATALTKRLRAAEAVCEAADKEHQSGWSHHDRYACDVCIGIYAWRNAKGET